MTSSAHNAINQQQNSDRSLTLLKAADVAHRSALRSEAARAVTVALLAAASIIASVYSQLATWLAILGVVATLGTELAWPWLTRTWTHTATLIQEMLDTELFGLEWNRSLGTTVLEARVHRLAARYTRSIERKRNWYVDVAALPQPLAVLVCQRENLLWDTDLRMAWARWVAATTTIWFLLGLLIAVVAHWYTAEWLIRWVAPSAPAIVFAVHHAYGHWRVAVSKDLLREAVDTELNRARLPITAQREGHFAHKAREFQDGIARLRDRTEHVPDFYYRRRRPADEAAHAFDAREFAERLHAGTSKP